MDENKLNTIANISQLYSLMLLLMDSNNNEIMRELHHQDTEYFEKILEQLESIKKTIEELKK